VIEEVVMREILFRGKRLMRADHEWLFGHYIEDSDGDACIKGYSFEHPVIPETVGQYTGLDDIKGNRIFEGDVVKNSDGRKLIVEWRPNFCDFIFKYPEFGWRAVNVTKANITKEKIRVVGDIHDGKKHGRKK
jgi:hypothetical protein